VGDRILRMLIIVALAASVVALTSLVRGCVRVEIVRDDIAMR
jgi:hypothetical protein